MKHIVSILLFICLLFELGAQQVDTFYLHHALSKKDTIIYKRIIQYDSTEKLYHVRDFYPSGKRMREGHYSQFDKNIFASLWCNYHSNVKEGEFYEWFENGQIESQTNYSKGYRHGLHEYWYSNGQRESIQNYFHGQEHGKVTYWDTSGTFIRALTFKYGINQHPKDTSYHYILYKPKGYKKDTLKNWPLIIYLHGGSGRGVDTLKLYAYGIPDQIWRGREFPFIIASPQCPLHHRWSTDNWFEPFYDEISTKYRVDTNKVYLTGVSLGGSGTWYLATKYPDKFAAIAPMSGFTHHMDFIDKNIDNLSDMPIWAFHGKIDKVVPFEDTERIIKKLEDKNDKLRFTAEPEVGHWMHWLVYPEQELYDWFLQF